MTLPRLPMTLALAALLESATGKPVGLARDPLAPLVPGEPEQRRAEPPFSILWSIPGSTYEGPWTDDHADATWTYQVTVVANRADQAEWLMDKVRAGVLGRAPQGEWAYPLEVPGMYVMDRRHVADAGGDTEGSIVSLVERYALAVTPSG